MNKIKNFLFGFLMFFLVSCWQTTTTKNPVFGESKDSVEASDNVVLGTPVQFLGDDFEVTLVQIDSICTVDGLPNIDGWLTIRFRDEETSKIFSKKMCIKYAGNDEIVYTILFDDEEPYPYSKRITKR